MKLRISNSDHLLLEDELGNPMWRYVGIHPGDVEQFYAETVEYERVKEDHDRLQDDYYRLEMEVDELTDKLDRIQDIL